MRKKIILLATVVALITVAGLLIFTHQPETQFDGERISNPGHFALRFDWMNMTESETMEFQQGDALHVFWQIDSGHVDIAIGMKGEEAVYRADNRPAGDKADFVVEIPQTGLYTINVSAREAEGQIEFLKTNSTKE